MLNKDDFLKRESTRVVEERQKFGLDGLIGGLEFVIINTEPDKQEMAVSELLCTTGFECSNIFESDNTREVVLSVPGSADIIVRSRKKSGNPFLEVNAKPLTQAFPNTRLETLVFATHQLEKYVDIQKSRGIKFLTPEIQKNDKYLFIQMPPSPFTGNSIGFVEWLRGKRDYFYSGCRKLDWRFEKPNRPYLENIKQLDHIATRVAASNRDAAIIEFMELTNYNFDFAVYVESLNSITNVARLTKKDFALVFTSGIADYIDDKTSGPTEKFVHHYGARVHHMAFHTENIEHTYDSLAKDGLKYLVELVGSEKEGLKQTFTAPFKNTMIVNEYIYRYGDFDGFFTKSNVKVLTAASDFNPAD